MNIQSYPSEPKPNEADTVSSNSVLSPGEGMSSGGALLLSVEEVQRYLKRSRASVYRYANTDLQLLNPPYDAQKLNPEVRSDKDAPLMFHPHEVRRFARDVLGLNPTIEVHTPEETLTHQLLREILQELKSIHQLLKSQPYGGK